MRRRAARQGCLLGPDTVLFEGAFALVHARSSVGGWLCWRPTCCAVLCHDPLAVA